MAELLCWCVSLTIFIVIAIGATVAAVQDIAEFGRDGDFQLFFNSLLLLMSSVLILALKLRLIN